MDAIKEHESKSQRPFVLGLPTGSSPLGVYQALVRMHKQGIISFKVSFGPPRSRCERGDRTNLRTQNVITFNMDEYLSLAPEHPQSYYRFMFENCKSIVSGDAR